MAIDSNTSPVELAKLLGTSYKFIKYHFYHHSPESHYNEFDIPKKNGGSRKIQAPSPKIKNLQRRLAEELMSLYIAPAGAKEFIKGTSIVKNAELHTRKKFVLNLDLENFFGSINFGRVRGLLINYPYNLRAQTASLIAQICCYDNFLPQGAPTSPLISNMVCHKLDRQLQFLASNNSANYSRYADDITFSFRCHFEKLPLQILVTKKISYFRLWEAFKRYLVIGKEPTNRIKTINQNIDFNYKVTIGEDLSKIISENGFKINNPKTRLQSYFQKQVVTGLVVNKKVNVDRRFIRATKAMIHSLKMDGREGANEKYKLRIKNTEAIDVPLEAIVQGRLLFIHMVKGANSTVDSNLAVKYNHLPLKYKVPVANSLTTLKFQPDGFTPHTKEAFEKVWVIEVEQTDGQHTFQGSGFMLEGSVLVTCSHLFENVQGDYTCIAFRKGCIKKYTAILQEKDVNRDLAALKLVVKEEEQFPSYQLSAASQLTEGQHIKLLGFPGHKLGDQAVSVLYTRVESKTIVSMVTFYTVDALILSGYSGGPALDKNEQIVGVVSRGVDDNKQGMNAIISSIELKKFLEIIR